MTSGLDQRAVYIAMNITRRSEQNQDMNGWDKAGWELETRYNNEFIGQGSSSTRMFDAWYLYWMINVEQVLSNPTSLERRSVWICSRRKANVVSCFTIICFVKIFIKVLFELLIAMWNCRASFCLYQYRNQGLWLCTMCMQLLLLSMLSQS